MNVRCEGTIVLYHRNSIRDNTVGVFHNKWNRDEVDNNIEAPINIDGYKTPNGYAIIVDQRFDTRELLQKWTNVELKRDDLLCAKWASNN